MSYNEPTSQPSSEVQTTAATYPKDSATSSNGPPQAAPANQVPNSNQAPAPNEVLDPERTAPTSRFGQFPMSPTLNAKQLADNGPDIVALHGITGDYEHTWSVDGVNYDQYKSKDKILWLRDYLVKDFPKARIFSYGYDARVLFSK